MLRVLQNQMEVAEARQALAACGLDTSRGWRRAMFCAFYTARYRRRPPPVATNKSWEVWHMLRTIETLKPDRRSAIYDVGVVNSEIPLVLWRRGYRDIEGCDVDPHGRAVRWYGNRIAFRWEDFYETSHSPDSVDVITALSTIEHGYRGREFFRAAQRLLKPGGLLCISTDYHEDKITIDPGFRLFGLPYVIFSRSEIEALLGAAVECGFSPAGPLAWASSDYPIEWLGHRYTFIYLAFVKSGDGASGPR